jgi:glyoxylase-like metal-dependent hydrolase (beta-lactamase superfamily II)
VAIRFVLDTHAHADHLTAAPYIKAKTGAPIGIGEHIKDVQRIFRPVFDARDVKPEGADFDILFKEGEHFALGDLTVEVMHLPGHTPADIAYRIGDDVFVGDTIFMPDYGTARCDFPGGDARTLYRSIQKVLSLGDHVRLHLCHDYLPGGREARWDTTVADERTGNVHVREGISEDAFVAMRTARDKSLDAPQLILPSLQVNIRAGALPPASPGGHVYLRLPINAL